MKPQVACQFLGKDDKTAKEFSDAVQQICHRANKALIIALENQIANLQVFGGLHYGSHQALCSLQKPAC